MHAVTGIGYQGLADTAALIAELQDRGVATVVDVRESPTSMRTGFASVEIATACLDVGIEYRHEPALGNSSDNRQGFKHAGPGREKARATMTERLGRRAAGAAMNRIWQAMHTGPVALLCMERDEEACHRRCILEAFAAKGFNVEIAPTPPVPPSLFTAAAEERTVEPR